MCYDIRMQRFGYFLLIAGIVFLGWYYFNQDKSPASLPTSEVVEFTTLENNANLATTTESTAQEQNNVTINNDKKMSRVKLQTNKGEITLELFDTLAPKTVANFTKLAVEGFYDGTKFHRVISGFMIQGGDPLTKDDSQSARWGTGGPGYKFADEIHSDNRNNSGTISMANAGPDTNGSQFFINVADNNFLDTKHTVFGKVVGGMDVISSIEGVQTDGSDRPLESVVIEKITVE